MKIKDIKSLGCFIDGFELDLTEENTIIFGYNGYGKTTLSRFLNSISSLRFDNYDPLQLKSLNKDAELSFKIFDFEGNPRNEPKSIVYNKDYIDSVITKVNFADNNLNRNKQVYENLAFKEKEEYLEAKTVLKDTNDKYEKEFPIFQEKVSNLLKNEARKIDATRLKSAKFDEFILFLEEKIEDKDGYSEIPFQLRFKEFESIQDDSVIMSFQLDSIRLKLSEYEESMKYTENEIKVDFLNYMLYEQIQWGIEGIKYITSNKCPFCEQNISSNKLVIQYKAYKSSKTNIFALEFEVLKDSILSILDAFQMQLTNVSSTFRNYRNIDPNSGKSIKCIDELYDLERDLKDYIELNYDYKLNDIGTQCQLSDNVKDCMNNYINLLSSLNIYILDLNNIFKRSKIHLRDEKNKYLKQVVYPNLENQFFENYLEFIDYEEIISDLNTKLPQLKITYEEALTEKGDVIKFVNGTFESVGVVKYKVNEEFELVHVSSNKSIDDCYKEKLSDGEKSIISFVLFYSELALGAYNSSELIVIDDPVNSLDYERLYNIHYLIKKMMQTFKDKKFIILTHNHIYFNALNYSTNYNILRIKRNDEKESYLEKGEKFNSIYLDKLSVISNISNNYELIRDYEFVIPNYCRYILESLSIFLYPNRNNYLGALQDSLLEMNENERRNKRDNLFNETKLGKLFGIINKGSHSTIEGILDQERYTNEDQRLMCNHTIRIIKLYAPEQLVNIHSII